jgi:hypothetical protein
MNDASMPNPDILYLTCLAEGYILTFQGRTIAIPDPAYAAIRIQDLLTQYETTRGSTPGRVDYTPVKNSEIHPTQTPQTPPAASDQVSDQAPTNTPAIDLNISRKNLQNLVRRRVSGEIRHDGGFFAYVAQFCPGLSEDEALAALDDAMADNPRTSPTSRTTASRSCRSDSRRISTTTCSR